MTDEEIDSADELGRFGIKPRVFEDLVAAAREANRLRSLLPMMTYRIKQLESKPLSQEEAEIARLKALLDRWQRAVGNTLENVEELSRRTP